MEYIKDIITFAIEDLNKVIIYLPVGLLFFCVMCLLGLLYTKKRKMPATELKKWIVAALLVGYLVIVLYITIFSREIGSRDGRDWMPFATMGISSKGDAFVLENVLLFIPLGILLPMEMPLLRRFVFCISVGIVISILIESIQLLAKCGYVQTDDVITNGLGTAVGYGIYRVWNNWGKRRKFSRLK